MWVGIVGAMGILYSWWAVILYGAVQGDASRVERPPVMPPPEGFEEDAYVHPLHQAPGAWRLWVVGKRCVVLAWCFVPFLVLSAALAAYPRDYWLYGALREWWLWALVRGCESGGCAFQKFGQWLSMRPDMMPPDVIRALAKLRQDVPEHPPSATRRVVREALGKEVEEVFEWFEQRPVASGSVAQLHRARLRPEHAIGGGGGAVDVAVKVRHPKVVEESFIDIDIIFLFLNFFGDLARGSSNTRLTIPVTRDEFQKVLQRQIDLRWEAHNLSRFRHNFCDDTGTLFFPEVHEPLLSESLLVETWVEGSTVSSIFIQVGEGLRQVGPNVGAPSDRVHKVKLCRTLFDMTMKMFLRDNLIHGDLHGGNVMHNPANHLVTVIDCGLVTGVLPDARGSYFEFLRALCAGNADGIAGRLVEFSSDQGRSKAELDAFKGDVEATVARWVGPGLRNPDGGPIQLGDFVGELLFHLQQHGLTLRGDVAGTIVSMSLVEGLARQLDPNFDVVTFAMPYFLRFPPPKNKP